MSRGRFEYVGVSQGSHFSALTKFQDFSRILYKIPGIIFFFFNVASLYIWVRVYTIYITFTPFCLHYPKVCIPPLTATHNDLYVFERWVLIKKKPEINDLMAANNNIKCLTPSHQKVTSHTATLLCFY